MLDEMSKALVCAWSAAVCRGAIGCTGDVVSEMRLRGKIVSYVDVEAGLKALRAMGQLPDERACEIAAFEREAATLTAEEIADFDAACREEGL